MLRAVTVSGSSTTVALALGDALAVALIGHGAWSLDGILGLTYPIEPTWVVRHRRIQLLLIAFAFGAFFEGAEEEIPFILRRESDEFTYGYALTVHKAQGSQWNDLVLFDESFAFREHRARWLYTGLTRAAERVTVVV